MKNLVLIGCLVLATSIANSKDKEESTAAAAAQTPAGGFSGKVVETLNTAGYTYVLVDTGSKKLWAAAPQFTVKVGDTVAVAGGMEMPNYHSKSLDRDFDTVYFSGAVTVNGATPGADGKEGAAIAGGKLPPNHPPLGSPTAKPKAEKVDLTGITRASGGLTVQEIFAGKSKLKGKTVKVRGKVVKYNPMVMGKNWLHLRDGTGTPGSDDLTVTTSTDVKIGDTVLVTGSVSTDKDFGSGYKYDVMLHEATVVVE